MTWPSVSIKRAFTIFSIFSFLPSVLLCFYIILYIDDWRCAKPVGKALETKNLLLKHQHHLGVLVPFRDRFNELLEFVPHIHKFLTAQNISFEIIVLNQVDHLRFNRASLINVGFLNYRNICDYFVIHDVDLLPLRAELSYRFPETEVFHVSSPDLHPKYHYATFLGGILIFKNKIFEKVNGMSNRYWGWGLEDDEFYTRLKDQQVTIGRPKNVPTGINGTFKHNHQREVRKRDMRKCSNQLVVTRRRDRVTGLHNVKFNIIATVSIAISQIKVTVVNIELICDRAVSPWCVCDATSAT